MPVSRLLRGHRNPDIKGTEFRECPVFRFRKRDAPGSVDTPSERGVPDSNKVDVTGTCSGENQRGGTRDRRRLGA
jgi:hypothetical protein